MTQAGDQIVFWGHLWRVLNTPNNTALLITEHIIDQRAYHDKFGDVTWTDCAYLNGAFYETFSKADRAKIVPAVNKTLDNPWYGVKGGDDTEDRIFLLSLAEAACHYFGDSSAFLYHPGKTRNTGFREKMKTTADASQPMTGPYGGGFARPDAPTTVLCIFGVTAISGFRETAPSDTTATPLFRQPVIPAAASALLCG